MFFPKDPSVIPEYPFLVEDVGLLSAWPVFDGLGSTSRVFDLTHGGNDIAFQSGGGIVLTEMGYAMSFNGSTEYATADDDTAGGDFTVSAWIISTDTDFVLINGVDSGTSVSWYMGRWSLLGDTSISFGAWDGSDWQQASSGLQTSGEPQLLTGVYDGTDYKIYINGQLEDTQIQGAPTAGNVRLDIGRYSHGGGGYYFTGEMNDLRIYNRALSAAEVWELFDVQTRWKIYTPDAPEVWPVEAVAAGANPKGPLGMPLHGPFGGPV